MRDGRIGFIDFGIVGSIAPSTWAALQALLDSTSTADYATMARAMATLGVTRQAVDTSVRPSPTAAADTPPVMRRRIC